MVFQLRPEDGRSYQYPNAQDIDFLGYDRPSDRWKVDASGIKLYASGISVELDHSTDSVAVWSASGTRTIPTYLEGGSVTATINLDESKDSIRTFSASGTTDIPVYMTSPIEVEVDVGDSIKVLSASGTPDLQVYQPQARFDDNGNQYVIRADNLIPEEYDYIDLSYTGSNLTGVTYKTGGSGGTIVAALTLGYDGSDNLTSVEKT